jgi:hypothetical protein
MARPKTEFRNELKTRVTDGVYDGVQTYMTLHRCVSEARAISELLEIALYGEMRSVPQSLIQGGHETVQFGPKTLA